MRQMPRGLLQRLRILRSAAEIGDQPQRTLALDRVRGPTQEGLVEPVDLRPRQSAAPCSELSNRGGLRL